jgi:hypothetical protein
MNTVKTLVEVDGKVHQVRVPSASRRDLTHKVVLSCTCEGFQLGGGYCYHLAQAAQVLRDDARFLAARNRSRIGR